MTIASMSENYNSNEAEVILGLLKVVHEDQLLTQLTAA